MNSSIWPIAVPDSQSPCGKVKIESFTVTPQEARMANVRARSRYEMIKAGDYRRLIIDGDVVMSNTPMEILTNREFVSQARGKVLINGLGFGMVLEQLLLKDEVEHITVIEKDPRVIELVGKHYENNPFVTIIEADALEYKPPKGEKYDVVYHDIWTFICGDNVDDMKLLHRRYGRKCDWQASWARDECEYQRKLY